MSRPRKDTSSADTSSKIRNYVLEQIDDEGKAKLQKVIDHYLEHANVGAIGGGLTYSISPTSLGEKIEVSCFCGKIKEDLTNYGLW